VTTCTGQFPRCTSRKGGLGFGRSLGEGFRRARPAPGAAPGTGPNLVKVHPVVTSSAPQVDRTDTCAVVALGDVPAWIAALPAQRSLSAARLQRVRRLPDGMA